MKIFKRILLLLCIVVIIAVFFNYPKLNIIAGYSAKNTASSVFVAKRTLEFTDKTDNNFSPINLATDLVKKDKKEATSSVFNLLTRKAIYREGLGAVLTLTEEDETATYLVPKRAKADNITPYPYGNAEQKDTVFANINYDKLNETVASVFGKNQSRAVVVIYKDQIVAEKYADGFTKDSKILGWSMTKSIMSTVFGVMQHQNKLKITDKAPIDAWQNDERKNISIHNLLQMNSGLEWDENYDKISDVTKMLFLERDMTAMQENKPLLGKINASWNYSSGTSNLLSGIARKQFKTHQEYLDYWYTNLIDKIGMNSMVLETDLAGNYVASSYAWATPRDWGKFGLLYLHKGNWNGEQIFDKDWANYVATPTPTSNGIYGAQFWLNAEGQMKDVPKNMYFADGYQGQRVYVLPDQDLVIVRMALSWMEENKFLKGVLESIKQ
ncbi:serine hydrolase [Polaribacter reichenbachii]|uniref:Serine hydrolase n=1 Tax=Polaribacter reichenbachii TaxID=996801 RepID=A0A1B8TUK8_9FLAO|nr:serine hydrolase [Polaribacter reichenbachii]APZ45657.1 serine hydrolase [Polaribacter reichenbachii]AUC19519.1 serine hydrolase [Polaribacter reichenbachii]OBY63327.1 serine hydrolase [Polaribacter reichenbachii]